MSQFKPTGGELLMISRMQELKASQSEDALSIQKNVTFYNNQEVLCHQEQNIALTELGNSGPTGTPESSSQKHFVV